MSTIPRPPSTQSQPSSGSVSSIKILAALITFAIITITLTLHSTNQFSTSAEHATTPILFSFTNSTIPSLFSAAAAAWASIPTTKIQIPTDKKSTKPTIIFILADDLGHSSVSWNNPEIQTPFLQNLLNSSLLLTSHYSFRTCGPSRASLLTGRFASHVSQENPFFGNWVGGIHQNFTLLPSMLKQPDPTTARPSYKTHFLGKWHAGMGNYQQIPSHRGFDTWLGFFSGAQDHYSQSREGFTDMWYADGKGYDGPAVDYGGKGLYGDEVYTDRLVDLIGKHGEESEGGEGMFAYYAMQVAHTPLQSPQKFEDLYSRLTSKRSKETRSPSEQQADRKRAGYNSMVSFIDYSVEKIVGKLKKTGMWENTILVFASDNGAPTGSIDADSANNYPLRGGKYSDFEGGIKTVSFVTGGYLPANMRGKSIGQGNYKQRVSIADWYATFADIAGLSPTDHKGDLAGLPPIDSVSVWPLLNGENLELNAHEEMPLTTCRCGFPGSHGGFIMGKYKLLVGEQKPALYPGINHPNGTSPNIVRVDCKAGCLFDLEEDEVEHNDLSSDPQYKDILTKMQTRFKLYVENTYAKTYSSKYRSVPVDIIKDLGKKNVGGFMKPYLQDEVFEFVVASGDGERYIPCDDAVDVPEKCNVRKWVGVPPLVE